MSTKEVLRFGGVRALLIANGVLFGVRIALRVWCTCASSCRPRCWCW